MNDKICCQFCGKEYDPEDIISWTNYLETRQYAVCNFCANTDDKINHGIWTRKYVSREEMMAELPLKLPEYD